MSISSALTLLVTIHAVKTVELGTTLVKRRGTPGPAVGHRVADRLSVRGGTEAASVGAHPIQV